MLSRHLWLLAAFAAALTVQHNDGSAADPLQARKDIAYADDPLQKLDIYSAPGSAPQPVVVYIHGGGWRRGDKALVADKPQAFADHGFAFVSVNYRLYPQADYRAQAADIARAIKHVIDNAGPAGIDPSRIYLMGYSAGAHLAALVATDGQYLESAGLSLANLKGVVLLDGAGYDIPWQIANVRRDSSELLYTTIFGKDPQVHRQASPISHVAAGKGIPPFLILPIAARADSGAQSDALAARLKETGVAARVVRCPNQTHGSINQQFGTADHLAATEAFRFLKDLQVAAVSPAGTP